MGAKSNQSQSVHFYFEGVRPTLENRKRLKDFFSTLAKRESRKLNTLNYIFCRDKDLLQINRKYLHHDFYTDVITFDLSSSSKEILADIYISVDRVKDNARVLGFSFKEELHRVMVHGLLHLCGYTDKSADQRNVMRKKESFYLDLYFTRFT